MGQQNIQPAKPYKMGEDRAILRGKLKAGRAYAKQSRDYSNTRRERRPPRACRLSQLSLILCPMDYQNKPTKKLTRKQIAEGLQSMPIETLLLGVNNSKTKRLTAKQIAFAEEVANGTSKAAAYRKSHNSKGKPKTQSQEGQNLTKNPAIAEQIEAFRLAMEAQKYLLPAHLRALTIHKLTEKALDPAVPPAQQIKALELLGKITEVALFTERREIITISDPEQIKDKLLASLRSALGAGAVIDVEAHSVESLLAEISDTVPDSADPDPDPDIDSVLDDAGEPKSPATSEETPSPSTNPPDSDPTDPQPQNLNIS